MLLKYDPGEEDEDVEMEKVEESGEDDDDTDTFDDIQWSLLEVLDEIEQDRTWASHGPVLSILPIPGLHLSQGGVVGLPLSLQAASRIKQHASQSGSEINPSVDDDDLTCGLDPSQLELRNPMWHDAAQVVGLEAVRAFDVWRATIRLRKLTLSGPSRPLNLWQGLNPDPAAFGSLMIVLPSLHQGGDIKLTYGNETNQFSTAITSEFGYSFVAWFSDVQLEFNPILSGYRLHLLYDLHEPMNQIRRNPSASALLDQATAYKRMLEQWSRLRETRGNSNPLVAYILEGRREIKNQCIKSKVCFWLARSSSSFENFCDRASESVFQLDKITELDGDSVVQGIITIGREYIVEIDSFERREPYDSDPAEVDSASGHNVDHFKDRVFLLLPESQRMQFLADNMSAEELVCWMSRRSYLIRSSRTQAKDIAQETSMEEQRKELAFVCQRIISMERCRRRNEEDRWLVRPDHPMFSEALAELVRSTLVARQVNLFGAAVTEYPSGLTLATWYEIGEEFNNKDILHGGYKDRLAMALSKIPTLNARQMNLETMLFGYDHEVVKPDDDPLRLWARENIVSALSSLSHATEEDGSTLAAIEQHYGKDILKEREVSVK